MFICFLSLFVNIQVSDAYVNVLSIIVFFSLNFSFFDMLLFSKSFCSIKYVLLAFFILLLSSLNITPKYLKFSTLSNLYFFIFKCPILGLMDFKRRQDWEGISCSFALWKEYQTL